MGCTQINTSVLTTYLSFPSLSFFIHPLFRQSHRRRILSPSRGPMNRMHGLLNQPFFDVAGEATDACFISFIMSRKTLLEEPTTSAFLFVSPASSVVNRETRGKSLLSDSSENVSIEAPFSHLECVFAKASLSCMTRGSFLWSL